MTAVSYSNSPVKSFWVSILCLLTEFIHYPSNNKSASSSLSDFDEETRALIEEIKPGGVIVFGRNVESPDQLRALLDAARAISPINPLFGIDQEGGLVD